MHFRNGFTPWSLNNDHHCPGQHSNPAEPEQNQQDPASPYPSENTARISFKVGVHRKSNLSYPNTYIAILSPQTIFVCLLTYRAHILQILLPELGIVLSHEWAESRFLLSPLFVMLPCHLPYHICHVLLPCW